MDYDAQRMALAERLRQAQAMQQAQVPQGQMVGRIYVPPAATQYLATGLKQYLGAKGAQDVMKEQTALGEKQQTAIAEALRNFGQKAQGAPAQPTGQTFQTGANEMGDEAATVPQWAAAQKPDLAGAYAGLLNAPDKGLQQFGMQGVMSTAQAQAQAAAKAAEQQRMLSILQGAQNPQQAIAAGVPPELVKQYYEARNLNRDKVKFEDVGGQKIAVNEYGDQPAGVAPLQKTGNPFSDLVVRDPKTGAIIPNAPLASTKAGIAAAGKPQISVDARNYNTQESEQSKVYGKQLGEIRGMITQAGIDAPKRIAQVDRMDELLNGIDGGRFAPAGAEVASAANSLGIKLDPKLGNKQAAEALAIEMALKMRPPGSGPMTDKDFDNFLKTVPSLAKTSEGRAQISQTMRAALQRDMEAAKFSREYARQNGGVIDDNYFEALADFYGKNPVVTPQMPATNARGTRLFEDADAILNRGKK